MKHLLSLLAVGSLATIHFAHGQTAVSPETKPVLTPEQAANVLKQLADLEKSILQQRGSNLGGVIQKLRTAASSDAAAVSFIEDCDKLVNVERKDGDREEAKRIEQRAEQAKRNETKKEEDKDGDHVTGLRLCLEYLALTLEANDAKDLCLMVPKVQAFHQTLLSHGKKLKGRTGDMLMRPIAAGGGGRRGGQGGGLDIGVVIDAYQLDRYIRREGWPLEPGNIIRMYQQVILKSSLEKHKDDIGSLWDTGITTEASYRKERLAEGEFTVWQQNEYPALKWQRATDLVQSGPNPVTGMAEMLKVIKDHPGHPSSPEWVKQLRSLVTPDQPVAPAGAVAP